MPKNALQGNGLILTQGAMNSTMYNQNNTSGNGSQLGITQQQMNATVSGSLGQSMSEQTPIMADYISEDFL